jgi:hypothetical protein
MSTTLAEWLGLPQGYEAVRFPVTIEISWNGRHVFALPVPYDPMTQEEWRKAVVEAYANLSKPNPNQTQK